MTIDFTNNTSYDIELFGLENVLDIVADIENLSQDKTVCLVVVDSHEMKFLNKKFRGVNRATDVLSFPSENEFDDSLGDIIIDIQTAEKQKDQLSLDQELMNLFIHGILHLVGYDHITANDKTKMDSKESEIKKILEGD